MNKERVFTANIGAHTIQLETGKLAGQAGGAVVVRCGDVMLLATATATKKPRVGIDFFPLSVDFEERLYAAGKIPGGFLKREGRPTEAGTLLCRLTDRPLRPLFPKGMRNDVQIAITALSADQENFLDVLAIVGASAALTISDIPWGGPIGAVRVGYIDGDYVFNPTASQMENSLLDLRVAGTAEAILMVEAGASVVSEELMLEGLKQAHEAMQDIIRLQLRMRDEVGKTKFDFIPAALSADVRAKVVDAVGARVLEAMSSGSTKEERYSALAELEESVVSGLTANVVNSSSVLPT